MRPLFFHDPKANYLRKEQGNFLIGSDLLIVPKWNKEGSIPSGNWRNISINGENSLNHKYHPDLKIDLVQLYQFAVLFKYFGVFIRYPYALNIIR